jgi:hypothetical protein
MARSTARLDALRLTDSGTVIANRKFPAGSRTKLAKFDGEFASRSQIYAGRFSLK